MAPKKCTTPNVSKQYVIPTVICPPGCTLDKISGLCVCSPGSWAPCGYGIPTCNCNGLPLCVTQTQFFGERHNVGEAGEGGQVLQGGCCKDGGNVGRQIGPAGLPYDSRADGGGEGWRARSACCR